jgi:uncharacterized protein
MGVYRERSHFPTASWKAWHFENGQIEREINYKRGNRHGANKRYSEDGELANVFYYKDDVAVSYAYNDKNGQLLPPKQLKGGSGKVVTYYSNGNKSTEMEFADGTLTGPYKVYHPNGKLYYYDENIVCGYSNGTITEYYPNGNPKSVIRYVLDEHIGPYKIYYEDGKIKEEGSFYLGFYNGPRKFYDTNGKLYLTLEYYYGLIVNIVK